MPRRNRVDPWGDLHVVPSRGLFTGNRGCLVDDSGRLTRHHKGSLWITCQLQYADWQHPLESPRVWTPLFFLDDAVALAAGHRPCGFCRRAEYLAYRDGVTLATALSDPLLAADLNRRLAAERLRRGSGLNRAQDRILWTSDLDSLPAGTVILDAKTRRPLLVTDDHLRAFSWGGWEPASHRPPGITVDVLTPPTSVAALKNRFKPRLHPTASA